MKDLFVCRMWRVCLNLCMQSRICSQNKVATCKRLSQDATLQYKPEDMEGGSNLENRIDRILFSAQDLKRKLDSIKNHDQEPRMDLSPEHILFNHKLKKLQQENTELREALEDHQYGLEFIMSKYRSQVIELIRLNKMEKTTSPPDTLSLKRNNSVE